MSLAHNGSGVFGAKRHFLASTNCVKVFRSKFKLLRSKFKFLEASYAFSGLALAANDRVW